MGEHPISPETSRVDEHCTLQDDCKPPQLHFPGGHDGARGVLRAAGASRDDRRDDTLAGLHRVGRSRASKDVLQEVNR